jgi:hypothetical protein
MWSSVKSACLSLSQRQHSGSQTISNKWSKDFCSGPFRVRCIRSVEKTQRSPSSHSCWMSSSSFLWFRSPSLSSSWHGLGFQACWYHPDFTKIRPGTDPGHRSNPPSQTCQSWAWAKGSCRAIQMSLALALGRWYTYSTYSLWFRYVFGSRGLKLSFWFVFCGFLNNTYANHEFDDLFVPKPLYWIGYFKACQTTSSRDFFTVPTKLFRMCSWYALVTYHRFIAFHSDGQMHRAETWKPTFIDATACEWTVRISI